MSPNNHILFTPQNDHAWRGGTTHALQFLRSNTIRGAFFAALNISSKPRKVLWPRFGNLPDERVALVLEDPDLLDAPEGGEGLLQQLLAQADRDPAAVDGAVGRTRLVVHLVKGQGFRVGCREKRKAVLNFCARPFSRFSGARNS